MEIESHAEKIGPGWWSNDHYTTLGITTEAEEIEFIRQYTRRLENFPCGVCRPHAVAHLATDDIEAYRNIFTKEGKRIGMFLYTVNFHNGVDKRLNKPQVDPDTAYAMWSNPVLDEKKVGAGWWINDHITALGAQNDEQESIFIAQYKRKLALFPSGVAYLAAHDIEAYRGIVSKEGVRIGMFMYTVEFHNHINLTSVPPKRAIDQDDAFLAYNEVVPCNSGCGK